MSKQAIVACRTRIIGAEIPALTGVAATAQAALASLLSPDPRIKASSVPYIARGNVSTANPVGYPMIAIRATGGHKDPRFRVQSGARDSIVVAMEVWNNTTDVTVLDDIEANLDLLFDLRQQQAPVLPASAGWLCYDHEKQGPASDLFFHAQLNAWYRIIYYVLEEIRYPA